VTELSKEVTATALGQPDYDGAKYKYAMYYTVEIRGSHQVDGDKATVDLEIVELAEAIQTWQRVVTSRPDNADWWVNLVVWAGRSDPDGGPPTGYILMRSHGDEPQDD
jgi:hypothetical protein